MTFRSTVTRTATIALAAAALAAPTASAQPADAPPAAAKENAAEQQHKQARRSADANGVSRYRHAGIGAAREYPTRPAQGEQANPRPNATTTTATKTVVERDIAWTTIGLWVATGLLALALIASIVGRLRSGRSRITA